MLGICIIFIRFDYNLIWHRRFCCHVHICTGLFCSSCLNSFFPPTHSPARGEAEKQLPA